MKLVTRLYLRLVSDLGRQAGESISWFENRELVITYRTELRVDKIKYIQIQVSSLCHASPLLFRTARPLARIPPSEELASHSYLYLTTEFVFTESPGNLVPPVKSGLNCPISSMYMMYIKQFMVRNYCLRMGSVLQH